MPRIRLGGGEAGALRGLGGHHFHFSKGDGDLHRYGKEADPWDPGKSPGYTLDIYSWATPLSVEASAVTGLQNTPEPFDQSGHLRTGHS